MATLASAVSIITWCSALHCSLVSADAPDRDLSRSLIILGPPVPHHVCCLLICWCTFIQQAVEPKTS